MTPQEILDTVVPAMIRQAKPSVNHHVVAYSHLASSCRYRSMDGSRCAAGVLIGDTEYSQNMEGRSFCSLVEEGALTRDWSEGLLSLVDRLQGAHDRPAWDLTGRDWLTAFLDRAFRISSDFGLVWSKEWVLA